MKTNVTYVDAAKFEALIKEAGMEMREQAGFVKVLGPKGRNLYVAATKRVGRVDISGFEVEWGITPHCGPFGNVKQQLDFSKPEDEILNDFVKTLEHMKTLEPVEKKARKAPAEKADAPKGWSAEVATKSARLKKIKAKAEVETTEA